MYISRVGALRNAALKSLRVVMFAGEALPVPYLIDWMKTLPGTEFHNCYGPTETTGVSLSYRVPEIPRNGEKVPIGAPCKEGMKTFLIDENGGNVPVGQLGEILLAGPGLSMGYWNDKDKTDSVFFKHPGDSGILERVYRTGDLGRVREDGNLEFAGRKDRQVKIMGYRIELGEIEHHLMRSEGVEEAVALAVSSEGGEHSELVILYTGSEEVPSRLKEALGKALPPYMVPKKIFRIKEFPRCPRGKISYKDLGCYLGED
jgi:D-alanine--poly(phosphoribitol) ligase subunit 1